MGKENKWEEELAQLRSVIEQTPLEKTIKWGTEVYTYKDRNVVTLIGFKHHFALWFTNGVFLSDPYKMLVSASEGKTKAMRQWRFKSQSEIDEHKILKYLKEAIKNEEQGIFLKPAKFTPLPIPELLSNALQSNKELNAAFKALSPGKQKEYIQYLVEAKRATTRDSRLEKIKPLILQGVGLHDQYK